MDVDYSSVGGIGVEFTDEMMEAVIEKGLFTEEEWDDDRHECMETIGLSFSEGGNSYSGDTDFYLLVDGETLGEINDNADKFVATLREKGIDTSVNELQVISAYHVW